MIGWLSSLLNGSDTLDGWTPARAAQAERDTLRAQGVVVEPHFIWSRPAQEREREARKNRMQRSAPSAAKKAQRWAVVTNIRKAGER